MNFASLPPKKENLERITYLVAQPFGKRKANYGIGKYMVRRSDLLN